MKLSLYYEFYEQFVPLCFIFYKLDVKLHLSLFCAKFGTLFKLLDYININKQNWIVLVDFPYIINVRVCCIYHCLYYLRYMKIQI